ncbi:N5-carboxyaminoimidazole ribonucleotide mutase [uncultured archaeon]|nr:N5-carboxyaminoimidazole ribonucleotide mutase [uncultured archaeon]
MAMAAVIMGSKSDYEHMSDAINTLREFGVEVEARIVSAHRTPQLMYEFASSAADRGIEVIIAGAGGAAHLPGMTASMTTLPVIGVPVPTRNLKGIDSLLSIVQMPSGIPVATVAIGNSKNAALLALRILSIKHEAIRRKVSEFMENQKNSVLNQKLDTE